MKIFKSAFEINLGLTKPYTVFLQIVSAETILFWIWPYVLWPLITVNKSAETIQGRKLFAEIRYQEIFLTVFWGEGLERYLSRIWNSSLLSARAALLIILSCGSLVDDNCNKGLGPPVLKGLGPEDLSSEGPPMPPEEALKLLLFEVLFLCSWLSTLVVDPADALESWVSNMSGHVQEWGRGIGLCKSHTRPSPSKGH